MKKKSWMLLFSAIFILALAIPKDVEAAGKKAVKVTISEKDSGTGWINLIIKGKDKNGKVVWKKTKKYAIESGGAVSREASSGISPSSGQKYCNKNRVYIIVNNKLITLNKKTGKKIRSVNLQPISGTYGLVCVFDKSGNLYIAQAEGPNTLMKINPNGKIVWKYTGGAMKQVDWLPTIKYKNGKIILKNYSNL